MCAKPPARCCWYIRKIGNTTSALPRIRNPVAPIGKFKWILVLTDFSNPALGDPYHEVDRYARYQASDLIVIGTVGRTGSGYHAIGSLTGKVFRKAHCPVLIVPSAGS